MEDFFLDAAASNGVWAALSLALIFFILRAQERRDAKQDEREQNYQKIIEELTQKLHIITDMREDIEMLEDHAHLLAMQVDVDALIGDIDAVEDYLTAGRVFHAVETAEERALARSRRSDDTDHFSIVDGLVYAPEDLEIPEGFFKIPNFYHSEPASSLYMPPVSTA